MGSRLYKRLWLDDYRAHAAHKAAHAAAGSETEGLVEKDEPDQRRSAEHSEKIRK